MKIKVKCFSDMLDVSALNVSVFFHLQLSASLRCST